LFYLIQTGFRNLLFPERVGLALESCLFKGLLYSKLAEKVTHVGSMA
jgi:hypothetical protein